MLTDREKRLPKWVQMEIRLLRIRLKQAREMLNKDWQDTPTDFCIAQYDHGTSALPGQKRFLPLGQYDQIMIHGIEVTGRDECEVRSPAQQLIIYPVCGNVAIIGQGRK